MSIDAVAPDGFIAFVCTADLERAHAFYAGALGLPLVLDQGTCRIYRVRPGAHIGVCRRADETPAPGGLILTIVTDDVDGWYARLAAANQVLEGPPKRNDTYRIYHFFARDPDGRRIEVQRFLEPDWRP